MRRAFNFGPLDFDDGETLARVSGCEIDQVADLAFLRGLDVDQLDILDRGWWRCSPCRCGDVHTYDLEPVNQGERGAFFAYLVGRKCP